MTLYRWDKNTALSQAIDTLRHFVDILDYSDHDGVAWMSFMDIAARFWPLGGLDTELLLWLVKSGSSEIRRNFSTKKMAIVLCELYDLGYRELVIHQLLRLDPSKSVNSARSPDGYTALHYQVANPSNIISLELVHVADIHALGFDPDISPHRESPTSLALTSSLAFRKWRKVLEKIEVDMDTFAHQEIQRGPLCDIGFKQTTLRRLLTEDWKYPSKDYEYDYFGGCNDCGRVNQIMSTRFQPHWMMTIIQFNDEIVSESLRDDESDRFDGERTDSDGSTEWQSKSTESAQDQDARNITGSEGVWNDDEKQVQGLPRVFQCPFRPHEFICIDCSLFFQSKEHRFKRSSKKKTLSRDGDDDNEDFSPFMVHC